MEEFKNNKYTGLAFSIAFFLIVAPLSSAVSYARSLSGEQPVYQVPQERESNLDLVSDVSPDEFVRGNQNADVFVIEYSDTGCPFCARFHDHIFELLEKRDDVGWVYRHSPLDSFEGSRKGAVAMECGGTLLGAEGFWGMADKLFETQQGYEGSYDENVLSIARSLGLSEDEFSECLASGDFDDEIQRQRDESLSAGGGGTPWSVIVGRDGKRFELSGAQPVSAIEALVDIAL